MSHKNKHTDVLKSDRQVAVRCRNPTRQRSSSLKMAATLATSTKEEQLSFTSFLSSEGVKPMEIQRRMGVQYDDVCLSLQQVYRCTSQ